MPLRKERTREAFEYNIRLLRREGRPMKQALAIAFSILRRGKPRTKKLNARVRALLRVKKKK